MNISALRGPMGQKVEREPRDFVYLGKVKMLPCCVCGHPPPSDAHHPIHDRFGTLKAADKDAVPLCKPHHQWGPDAIHNGKKSWREKHGPDHGYIEETRRLVEAMDEDDILTDWLNP